MPWGALAGQIGVAAIGSFLGGGGVAKYNMRAQQAQQASQAYLQGIGEIRQLSRALDVQAEQNQKVMRADMYNWVNTQYMQGLAQLQDSLSRRTASDNFHKIHRGERVDVAAASVQQAATGTVGASADAALRAIARNHDTVRAQVEMQRLMERDAYYQEVRGMYTQYYQNQLEIDTTLPDVPEDPRIYRAPVPGSQGFGQHLLGAAVQVGTSHLGDMFRVGLGNSGSSSGPSAPQSNVNLIGIRSSSYGRAQGF